MAPHALARPQRREEHRPIIKVDRHSETTVTYGPVGRTVWTVLLVGITVGLVFTNIIIGVLGSPVMVILLRLALEDIWAPARVVVSPPR